MAFNVEYWEQLSNDAREQFLSADGCAEVDALEIPDDAVIGKRCGCGGETFRLASTAKYELSAQCVACGWTGVVYDG